MNMVGSSAESDAFLKEGEAEEETTFINVRVKWVDEGKEEEDEDDDDDENKVKVEIEEVFFKIENDIPLRWLMIRYCDKIGANYNYTRFEFKGARLRESDTPLQLSMISSDVIFAFHFQYGIGRSSVNYATLCIRVHKERDKFLRVRRSALLLPQLMRSLFDVGSQEGSLCFVYEGSRLNQVDTADDLELEDGDIIDAFNFDENSSSLSILEPRLSLKVICDNYGSLKRNNFTIKRTTLLVLLMKRFCEMHSLQNNGAVFVHKGRRLMGSKTPEEEQLEDGDEITVFV